MSEQVPKNISAKDRLNSFNANKKAHEEVAYWDALNGDAGMNDFSDEARQRLEEADVYDAHLQNLANDNRSSADRYFDDVEKGNVESNGYAKEFDAALEENVAFDENARAEQAERDAFTASIDNIVASSSQLRRAELLAREVAQNKNYTPNAEDSDDVERLADDIKAREDKIEEIVSNYFESDEAQGLTDAQKEAILERVYSLTESPSIVESTSYDAPVDTNDDNLDNEHVAPEAGDGSDTDKDNTDDTDASDIQKELDLDDKSGNTNEINGHDYGFIDEFKESAATNRPDESNSEASSDKDLDATQEFDAVSAAKEEDADREPYVLPSWKNPIKRLGAIISNRRIKKSVEAKESKSGSKKQRNIALGAVAVAGIAIAAGIAQYKYNVFTDIFDKIGDGQPNGGGQSASSASLQEVAPTTPNSANNVEPSTINNSIESTQYSEAARTISENEGWFQAMKDMNIPADEWNNLLAKVGPELAKAENGSWAYQMADGQWGISRPGQLPDSVLQLIQNNR